MKVKTSISLSEELLQKLDKLAGDYGNRSAIIEKAIGDFLAAQEKKKRETHDMDILNNRADKLNKEAQEVLAYQVDI